MAPSELYQLTHDTLNFEGTAFTVFRRLISEEGPGLLVLWGGMPNEKLANKGYFLNMVEAFQKGAAPAKPYVSEYLWGLLSQLDTGHYQCVRVIEDSSHILSQSNIYETPLAVAVSMAIAGAVNRRGLTVGRNIVILCDDIQKFMEHNKWENQRYLKELATSLDNQTTVTFLGASRLTWDAKSILGENRALALGWD